MKRLQPRAYYLLGEDIFCVGAEAPSSEGHWVVVAFRVDVARRSLQQVVEAAGQPLARHGPWGVTALAVVAILDTAFETTARPASFTGMGISRWPVADVPMVLPRSAARMPTRRSGGTRGQEEREEGSEKDREARVVEA